MKIFNLQTIFSKSLVKIALQTLILAYDIQLRWKAKRLHELI